MQVWKQPQTCNFVKKETLAQVFYCEFCEIFKNTFFYITPPDDCIWNMLIIHNFFPYTAAQGPRLVSVSLEL